MVAPDTIISVGKTPAIILLLLFCIINFVALLESSYKCNLLIGLYVPIPTFEVL